MEKEILELKEKMETQNEFLIFLERLVRKLDAKEDIDEDLKMISKGRNSPEAKYYRLILRFKEKLEGNVQKDEARKSRSKSKDLETSQQRENKRLKE